METGVDWFSIVCAVLFALILLASLFWSMRIHNKEVEQELRNGRVFKDCGLWGKVHVLEPLGTCVLNNIEYLEVLVTDIYAKKCWMEKRLLKDVVNKFSMGEHFWMPSKELSKFKKDKIDGKFRFV